MFLLFNGEILGKYRLVKPVKCSDISEVWIAVDGGGKFAVLKALHGGAHESERMVALARVLKQADCPGIVGILDCGVSESGIAYAAHPCMEGGSLAGFLLKNGRLSLGQTVCMLLSVLNGLAAIHALDIVHRDIKPANIWISKDGLACLGDFGIAKVPGFSDVSGAVFGSAAYMSPEQAKDTSMAIPASDLFSLGCVAYECLTGCHRYPQKSFTDTLKAVVSDRGIHARELEEFATLPFAVLLCKMMNPSPKMRPSSAEDIIREIESMRLPQDPLV